MSGETLVLQAARGDRPVRSAAISRDPITIGSWSGATLPLDDPDLPPVQVVLDPEGENRWRLIALVSEGCHLNGRQVQRGIVTTGDRLEIGPYEIEFSGNRHERHHVPAPSVVRLPYAGEEQPLRAILRWRGAPLDARVLAPGELLSIGHGREVIFELPGGDGRCWAAAACIGGVWHVALDAPARALNADDDRPLLSAEARTDGPELPKGFTAGRLWAPIPDGARARLDAGPLTIDLERCPTFTLTRIERVPWWASPDGQRTIITSLIALCIVAMFWITPRDLFDEPDEIAKQQEIAARFQAPPQSIEMQERIAHWQKKISKPDTAGSEKAKGAEGQAGRPDAPQRQARRAGPRSDADVVRDQALIKMLSSNSTQQLLQGGTLSAANALGHLAGPTVGDAQGMLGLGLHGTGSGGGGLGQDSVGVGPLGTKGVGLGTASKVGKVGRGGDSDLGMDEPASIQGGLDREVIRRVILSHRAQIRYCYEKQLSVTPDLAGKVLVEFVIAGDGSVTTARTTESTLSNSGVGSCIVSKVKGWTFPKPRGGGVVVVTYPFLFKPAGQGAH